MSKPLDFFNYQNGVLSTSGIQITELAKKFGTPFYVYQSKGFLTPLKALQEGLADLNHLVCFAVKSCSNIHVLKLLAENGAGMDLVSGGELFRVQNAGVSGDRIVFSGVGKTESEMEQALDYDSGKGVYSFNVESVEELFLLEKVAKRKNKIAPVLLRFNPDVNPKTHPYISTGLKKNKFGLNRKEILGVITELQKHSSQNTSPIRSGSTSGKQDVHSGLRSGIVIRGLSIHIGSQILTLSPFKDAFEKTLALANEIESITHSPLDTIDLGGGLGITYRDEKTVPLQKYAALIKKTFGSRFKILLEPGRTISANAGILVSKVLYKKPRQNKQFLVVDASMTELIRPALYQSYHHIIPVDEKFSVPKSSGKKKSSLRSSRFIKTDVVGPVCESSDCFAHDREFSSEIPNGSLVAFLSAGAYGFTMASQYNSRPRPPEILIKDGEVLLIRKRETLNDLIERELRKEQ